ncbi:hypothetical protein FEM08_06410 [Flavobacterium gilvum]|nr:hypothetical protein FEM08_06410 [Flavobacterium gilvum]
MKIQIPIVLLEFGFFIWNLFQITSWIPKLKPLSSFQNRNFYIFRPMNESNIFNKN